jgi:hypothetical protein
MCSAKYIEFDSASEIALWTLSGVLLIVFLLVTIYHPIVTLEDRLYPLHLMKRLELDMLQLAMFVAAGCMVTTLYYTPLLFQFTRNDGPFTAAIRLLPFLCGMIFFSVLNGVMMARLGYHMPWYVFGTAMILTGSALLGKVTRQVSECRLTLQGVVDVSTSVAYVYGTTLLIGSGCGAFFTAGFSVIQALLPASELSDGINFMSVGGYIFVEFEPTLTRIGQQLGFVVILSMAGTIFQNIAALKISRILPDAPRSDIMQLTTGTHSAVFKSLGAAAQTQVVE